MNDRREGKAPFRGYSSPNYTPVPDELFDEQLPDLSGAELKVLLYVIRRTFGFKRESDNISLSQMLNGLRTRDGRILDRGVGLSKKTLLQAIKSLEEQAIILTERRRSREKGDEPTSYRLNVRSQAASEETTPPVGEKVHHGGGTQIPPGGWGNYSPTQETVRQHTAFDDSKFEGSPDDLIPADDGERSPQPVAAHRRPPPAPEDPQAREQLRAFLTDFALELGDEAPLSSTITRTLTIFTAAAIPAEQWGDYLYQARGLTQEHTAQIRKTATGGEAQLRRKNKMPYFLATLEQLVGLRPAPAPAGRGARRNRGEERETG